MDLTDPRQSMRSIDWLSHLLAGDAVSRDRLPSMIPLNPDMFPHEGTLSELRLPYAGSRAYDSLRAPKRSKDVSTDA